MTNNLAGSQSKGEVIIYRAKDRKVRLEVHLERESVWLTQADIARLFGSDRSVITKHLSNIFQSGELAEKSNVQKMHIPGSGKKVRSGFPNAFDFLTLAEVTGIHWDRS